METLPLQPLWKRETLKNLGHGYRGPPYMWPSLAPRPMLNLSGSQPLGNQPLSPVTAIHRSPKLPLFLNNEQHLSSFTYKVILPCKRQSAPNLQIQPISK